MTGGASPGMMHNIRVTSFREDLTAMALLLSWHQNGRHRQHTLHSERPCLIGRSSHCDIVISQATVSREHVRIAHEQATFRLHVLSQTNPVFANGRYWLAQGSTISLQPDDTFTIGDVAFTVASPLPEPEPRFKIRCVACGNLSSSTLTDCPWCGASLAFGESLFIISDA